MSEKKIDASYVFPDLDRPTVYVNTASPHCVLHFFEFNPETGERTIEKTIRIKTDRMLNLLEHIRRA